MNLKKWCLIGSLVSAFWLVGAGSLYAEDKATQPPEEIDWDELIPEDWRPEELFADDYSDLPDDDPKVVALMEKLKKLWSEAPVVEAFDGRQVKLPGFVVPLETELKGIREFLLVPYFGACIHVPPPPANQTIHVVTNEGDEFNGELFDTVWVTGQMKVERLSSDLGDAGYQIREASVEPYEE